MRKLNFQEMLNYLLDGSLGQFVPDGIFDDEARRMARDASAMIVALSWPGGMSAEVAERLARLHEPPRWGRDFAKASPSFSLQTMDLSSQHDLDIADFEPAAARPDPQAVAQAAANAAASQGMQSLLDQGIRTIALTPDTPELPIAFKGLHLTLRPQPPSAGTPRQLQLQLDERHHWRLDPPTALLWSHPDDLHRTTFTPTGIAHLPWPQATRNTLRLDSGPEAAVIHLQIQT